MFFGSGSQNPSGLIPPKRILLTLIGLDFPGRGLKGRLSCWMLTGS